MDRELIAALLFTAPAWGTCLAGAGHALYRLARPVPNPSRTRNRNKPTGV